MRNALLVLFSALLLAVGCSHRTTLRPTQPETILRREPASPKNLKPVDLTSIQNKMATYQKLEKIFGGAKAQAEDIAPLLGKIKTDPQYSNVSIAYVSSTYRSLDVEDPFQWIEKNPENFGALNSYIDPQEDGEPIWATTNRRLRAQEDLTPEEHNFTIALKEALNALPRVKGIVFRGARLDADDLRRYQEKKTVTELPFTSTSIDPQIAYLFTQQNLKPGRVAVIFITRVQNGGPVSAFHPGNNHEVEVLLKPSTVFQVNRVLWTRDRKSVFIFMTE